jgi:hypothetical protein
VSWPWPTTRFTLGLSDQLRQRSIEAVRNFLRDFEPDPDLSKFN